MATVTIQKRTRNKGITYPVYYKDPLTGAKRYYKTFPRFREAQQAANDLRALLDAGKASEVKNAKRRISLVSFEEAGHSLRALWKGRADRLEMSNTTFRGYCDRLRLLERKFGKRLLCEISHDEILEYRNRVASETSNLTSNRSLFILKQVFKHAIDLNAIKGDPTSRIPDLSEKQHERNMFLLPPDLDRLIRACQETRSKYYLPAMIYLGAEHGASKQEVLDLKWSDVDFDFDGIGIIRFFRTKNSRERTEYLMPPTRQALLEWRQHQMWMRRKKGIVDKGAGYVFCRLDGTPLKGFSTSWRKVRRIAGFDKLHFHDLRHTFCSNLLLSGSDLKDVKEMIGHRDLKMTDRYSHLTSMRKLSRQVELARFYSNVRCPSGGHIGVTKGKNGDSEEKKAD